MRFSQIKSAIKHPILKNKLRLTRVWMNGKKVTW